jgi:hypothetical protein
MRAGQTVETLTDQIRGDRPPLSRASPPALAALHRPKAICIGLGGQARRVDDDGGKPRGRLN